MSVRADLLPPRYADLQEIGRGGMGTIYAAEDRDLRRRVAIKVLDEHLARDAALRRRFMREAMAAARLSGHRHIVTIYDVGEWNGRPFIVMEFLAGGTLGQRVRAGRPERRETLAWLEQTAEAIDSAHREGVVHRDVKPANLIFDERGELHVVDFGIARLADETTGGMTAPGTILGTAGYLSPEQARGERATPASDVYALGVVAYELLTGGRPFERGSPTAEAAAHVHEAVPPASERGVGIPREVDAVFERALAKDPSRRYRSAGDLVRALRAALEPREEPTRLLPGPALEPAAPAPPRRRSPLVPVLAAVALAGLALAGVVAAALLAGRGEEAAPPPEPAGEVTVTEEIEVTQPGTTIVTTVVETVQTPPAEPPPPPAATRPAAEISIGEAIALTDQATRLMGAGNYDDALPLALKARNRLQGTGHMYEAYSNYNVGRSLVELGRCDEALPYLDRSEQIQGSRGEIDDARARCR